MPSLSQAWKFCCQNKMCFRFFIASKTSTFAYYERKNAKLEIRDNIRNSQKIHSRKEDNGRNYRRLKIEIRTEEKKKSYW